MLENHRRNVGALGKNIICDGEMGCIASEGAKKPDKRITKVFKEGSETSYILTTELV